MSWSDGRRLAAVNENITYAYNADGLRIEKVVDGISYRYLYAGGNVEGILDVGDNRPHWNTYGYGFWDLIKLFSN